MEPKVKAVEAAIYVRHPNHRRRASQELRCSLFAASMGFQITDRYWDEAGDGWLEWMVDDAEKYGWKVLITLPPSRLGLTPEKLQAAAEALGSYGVATVIVPSAFRARAPRTGWEQRCHADAPGSATFGPREGDNGTPRLVVASKVRSR